MFSVTKGIHVTKGIRSEVMCVPELLSGIRTESIWNLPIRNFVTLNDNVTLSNH